MAADLLEIGELRHFHAIAPDLPSQTPGPERRAFPVILDKADVMQRRVQPDGGQRAEVEVLQIGGRGFDDHLKLVVMLQPVGVFAIAPIGRPARGLDIGGGPGARAQTAQGGCRVKGARAHLHVIGLQDGAAARRPIALQAQDDLLKTARRQGGGVHRRTSLKMRPLHRQKRPEGQCRGLNLHRAANRPRCDQTAAAPAQNPVHPGFSLLLWRQCRHSPLM